MVRPFPVIHVFAPVIALFGTAMFVPLAIGHLVSDSGRYAYDVAAAATVAAGAALWGATTRYGAELQVHHGYLLVALTWTVLPAFAALPLLLALPGLSFTDAYFETASAMTTT